MNIYRNTRGSGLVGAVEWDVPVALIVLAMPFEVLFVDIFTTVGGVFATDDEQQTTDNRQGADAHVQPNAEIITRSFHRVPPVVQHKSIKYFNEINVDKSKITAQFFGKCNF